MTLISAYFFNKKNYNELLNNTRINHFFERLSCSFKRKVLEIKREKTDENIDSMFFTTTNSDDKEGFRNLVSTENITVLANGSLFNNELEIKFLTAAKCSNSNDLASILLQSYLNYDVDCFKKLKGTFISIIFDKKKEKIIITRDRFGSNLIFLTRGKWGFAISSQIKSLLPINDENQKPNWNTISRYLFRNYRYAFGTNDTFFENINLISPNSLNIFNLKGELLIEGNLNNSDDTINSTINDKEATDTFIKLMEQSFEKRARDLKEEPAFLLSGGLDSPTVAALAANKRSSPIISYSICYGNEEIPINELTYDERDLIKLIVENNNINWRPIFVTPENFADIYTEMLKSHDEPIASPTWYSHWLLMKQINKDGFKTIFGGDGGDHALAGLYDDVPYYFADLKFEGKEDLLNQEILSWIKYHDHPVYKKNFQLWKKYSETCFDWEMKGKIKNYTWDEGQFRNSYAYEKLALKDIKDKLHSLPLFPSVKKSYLLSKLHQDLLHTSSPPSTRAEAINCEVFNIDLRSVFLDEDVIDFCWSLPPDLMIREGYMKYLIRISMEKYLPKEVIWNRKHVGLNSPANIWFRNELKELMESSIKWEGWHDLKLLKPDNLLSIWDEHLQCKNDHMMFLWKIFSLKKWLEKYT